MEIDLPPLGTASDRRDARAVLLAICQAVSQACEQQCAASHTIAENADEEYDEGSKTKGGFTD